MNTDYEASGLLAFLASIGTVFYAGRDRGEIPDGDTRVLLPHGSGLAVRFEPAATNRINLTVGTEPAWGVKYYARLPHGEEFGPVSEEWLSARDSALVQTRLPAWLAYGGDQAHQTRFTKTDRPAVLLTSVLWGRTLVAGDSIELAIRSEVAAGGFEPGHVPRHNLKYVVDRVVSSDAGCAAIVVVDVTLPGEITDARSFLTMTADSPLPLRYEGRSKYTSPEKPATLFDRVGHASATDGQNYSTLAPWKPRPLPTKGLPLLDINGSLFPDSGAVFPTPFVEARDAALAHPQLEAWMQENPSARYTRVDHVAGEPGSGTIDQWTISWSSPSGEPMQARVVNRSSPGPVLPVSQHFSVFIDARGPREYPETEHQAMVSLVALNQTSQAVFGDGLQVLRCRLASNACSFGPFENTGVTAAGAPGGGQSLTGLYVWTKTGLLMQEDSVGTVHV